MALVAVEGLTLAPLPPATGGTFQITSTASQKVKIDGNGVYFKELKFNVSGLVVGTPQSGSATGTIVGTGIHMADSDQSAVLQGDKITVSIQVESGQSTVPAVAVIQVLKAGQNYVDVT